jgi:chromosome segregation ATPase
MKEEQVTYSTGDMLKLINTAATNLLLKKNKVSLEAKILRQQEERNYTMELLSRARKKVEELDPELRKAEESVRVSRELFALLKAQRDALKDEADRLREIERKTALFKQVTAEAITLRERVDSLQAHNDRVRSAYIGEKAHRDDLENKKSRAVSAMHELREKLSSLTADREQLIARFSRFDLSGHLKTLREETSALGDLLSGKVDSMSLKEKLISLIDCLRCFREVDDLYSLAEEAGTEESKALSGIDTIKETSLLSGIREEMKKHIAAFAAFMQQEQYRLEERKRAIEGEIDFVGEELEGMKTGLPLLEEAIRSEQGFRDKSHVLMKELEDERVAKTAELKRIQSEAERFEAIRVINNIFTVSLNSSNEYIRNINKRLGALLEEYKRAFGETTRVIREEAG